MSRNFCGEVGYKKARIKRAKDLLCQINVEAPTMPDPQSATGICFRANPKNSRLHL